MENRENVQNAAEQVAKMADQAFSTALASAIMAGFPVASIIAIFKGVKGLKLANAARDLAEENGMFAGGKNIAARVLAINGIASGAYATLIYAIFAAFYVVWIAAAFLVIVLGVLGA